jgi:hypothetical protein
LTFSAPKLTECLSIASGGGCARAIIEMLRCCRYFASNRQPGIYRFRHCVGLGLQRRSTCLDLPFHLAHEACSAPQSVGIDRTTHARVLGHRRYRSESLSSRPLVTALHH